MLKFQTVKTITLAIACLLLNTSYNLAQTNISKLHQPYPGKMLLSANYFELRDNHFHSGVDIKVGGVVGGKLFSINDGYISRVSIKPGGYGNCIYVTHTDGTTSVYGHLNALTDSVSKFVKHVQYEKQQFELDTLLSAERFPVSKGSLVGYAGNSGYSFGPHLHFEIRDTAQVPQNLTKFYSFTDKLQPELNTLAIFSVDSIRTAPRSRITHSLDLGGKSGFSRIDSIINIESPAYIALGCIDKMNESHNRLGIRTMKVELDDELIFSTTIDNIPFDKSRYINSFIAYDEKQRNKKTLIKSYVEPGNELDIYSNVKNSGLIVLNDKSIHRLTISVTDDYGNTSTLNLRIQEKKTKGSTPDNGGRFFSWNKDNFHISPELIVHVPKGALYNNILFDIDKRADSTPNAYSPTYRLHTPETALHKPMKLAIKMYVPDSLQSKATVVYYNSEQSSKRSGLGGEIDNGYIYVNAPSFGYFFVSVDTIPPTLTPSFKNNADLRGQKEITIKIQDDLTGIASYNGYIDDKWVLFEYDAKRDMLIHTFDKSKIDQGKKHKLVLEVSDRRKNVTTFTSGFTW